IGPYERYAENHDAHNNVMRMHRDASYAIPDSACRDTALLDAARSAWEEAVALGDQHGYRNAQATVLAPTGTISFLMDCDTTGVEPDFSLVKFKELVGCGPMRRWWRRTRSPTPWQRRSRASTRRSSSTRRSPRPSRRSPRSPVRLAVGCRASASRSPTSSPSVATRGTSLPACTRTARSA